MKFVFLIIICVSFSVRSAAYHICFSLSDSGVPSVQAGQYDRQFKQALAEKDSDSIIYFMRWNADNRYPVDSELYRLQNQAIFFDAVLGNKIDVVNRMFENKTSIDIDRLTKVDYQLTALMMASSCGYKDMVKILLNAGANVNITGGYGGSNNTTALAEASKLYNNDNIELEDMDEIIAMLKGAGAKK